MWNQINLQDSNSFIMQHMIEFYDHAMLIIMMILMLVLYLMVFTLMNKYKNRYLYDNLMIEIIWILIPSSFLIFIALPSLKVLYLTDEIMNPDFSIKSIGHQWYWSYEYNNLDNLSYDSFMLNSNKLNFFRLLDVDNRLILPYNSNIRMLVSSTDVIHSFALPSIGIKMDAIPGRINQMNMNMIRPGLYFGQCSEICGVNHSFMPIVIESVSLKLFINWIKNNN